jgi:hypothetical protein
VAPAPPGPWDAEQVADDRIIAAIGNSLGVPPQGQIIPDHILSPTCAAIRIYQALVAVPNWQHRGFWSSPATWGRLATRLNRTPRPPIVNERVRRTRRGMVACKRARRQLWTFVPGAPGPDAVVVLEVDKYVSGG